MFPKISMPEFAPIVIGLLAFLAFISCFLLGYSFDVIPPARMALMFNANTRTLMCDTLYGAVNDGKSRRYFTGLGRSLSAYQYPMTAQVVTFGDGSRNSPVTGKTTEGANVVMSFKYQYLLPRDPALLCSIYFSMDNNYDAIIQRYAQAAVRDGLAEFSVYDMWNQRSGVSSNIEAKLSATLAAANFQLIDFQMLSTTVPNQLQQAIQNTTVAYQGIFQASLNLQLNNVTAVTTQLQAYVTGQVTVINATAAANATITNANAVAAAANITATADANGYTAFKNQLGMTAAQILEVAYIDAALNTPAGSVSVQMSAPSLVVTG